MKDPGHFNSCEVDLFWSHVMTMYLNLRINKWLRFFLFVSLSSSKHVVSSQVAVLPALSVDSWLVTHLTNQISSTSASLSAARWVHLSLRWRPVQHFKLDGGEKSGAEGPTFVLRHRTSNLIAQHTTESTPTGPMSPREKADLPTSGSSTSHLSTAECPSHSGVSIARTHLLWLVQSSEEWCGSAGYTVKVSHQNTHPQVYN